MQIIKGWLDTDGKPQERIYDIAVSDGRTIGADGRCKDPVGNTVNVEEATYSNAIGNAVLGGYWQDPDFDPAQRAFYYVRVLEIPTPRWTTYDAKFFGVKRPEDVPAIASRSGPIPRRSGTRRKADMTKAMGAYPGCQHTRSAYTLSYLVRESCTRRCLLSLFPIRAKS